MKKIVFLMSILFVLSAKGDVFALSEYDEKLLENGSLKGYLMSEKLDGIRALWDGKNLKSRKGNNFAVPECWKKNLPPFALDGELYIGRGKFEEVLSITSKGECEEWQKVGYYIFDVPEATGSLLERLNILEQYLFTLKNTTKESFPLFIIPQKPIKDKAELEKTLQELTNLGGEGLVIRKNNAAYENFRTKNALKLKAHQDSECKVIAHHKGKGKFANMLGSLTCEQNFGDSSESPKTLRFKIGSGFSDKERINPPPIGSLITYKFNGFTKKGLPKFPVFLRIYEAQ